ncbi:hypothetical protein Tco_0060254 [Tanacetum coccineum]
MKEVRGCKLCKEELLSVRKHFNKSLVYSGDLPLRAKARLDAIRLICYAVALIYGVLVYQHGCEEGAFLYRYCIEEEFGVCSLDFTVAPKVVPSSICSQEEVSSTIKENIKERMSTTGGLAISIERRLNISWQCKKASHMWLLPQ